MPNDELPQTRSRPFFDLLDRTLSDEITRQIGKPFWIDTVGRPTIVESASSSTTRCMHVLARRSQTYASNSQIFLLWMLGTSLGAAHRRHPVPAQPDQADPAPGRGRRQLRQGPPGAARFPPARRPRSAAGGAGLHRDARPHRAPCRAAHHHARRREPRSAHRADPLQAAARDVRGRRRDRGDARRRRRDAGHAGGLRGLCQGRLQARRSCAPTSARS